MPKQSAAGRHAILLALIALMCGCQSIQNRPNREGGLKGLFGLERPGQGQFDDDELLNVDPLGERSFNRLLLDDLSPGNLATTWKVRTTYKEDRPAAEAAYNQGQQVYQQAVAALDANPDGTDHLELFQQASNHFRLAAGRFPDSQLEQDALYFEGESYFFSNRYVLANRAFEGLITRYAGTRYLDNAEARRFETVSYTHLTLPTIYSV